MAQSDQPKTAARLLNVITTWFQERPGVVAIALVGSHARGAARPDSDLDLVLLVDDPQGYLHDQNWLNSLVVGMLNTSVISFQDEDYGALWSRRVFLDLGHEAVHLDRGLMSIAAVPPALLVARLEAIGAALARRPDALALIGLGSAGLERDRLDAYSNLDFFVVVESGAKPRYLANLDWLAVAGAISYHFRNTVDGYKLLYADGAAAAGTGWRAKGRTRPRVWYQPRHPLPVSQARGVSWVPLVKVRQVKQGMMQNLLSGRMRLV